MYNRRDFLKSMVSTTAAFLVPCVRAGKWKLLVNDELAKVELYDIKADWAEKKNLAGEHPEVVKKLKEQVLKWKKAQPAQPAKNCLSATRAKKGEK